MFNRKTILTGFLFIPLWVNAKHVTISGYVQDAETDERLIGANIVEIFSRNGTITNNYGYYNLAVPEKDSAKIRVSYIGYSTILRTISAKKDQKIDFQLTPGDSLAEVTVIGTRTRPIEQRNEMSVVSVPVKQMETLPALGGEPDLMKVMQLMPGVQSGNEGSSGLYVRGGGPDQNLILLDDVPLYYVNHLGGFVSIFNTDAISATKLIKGGFPASYGGRLSSILDVRMKEGNMKKFQGSGMIGLVASKVAVEGPLKKGRSSYLVSYRRFLYDLITMPISKLASNGYGFGYHFYDLNAKINHKFSDKDRLFLSIYSGDDQILAKMKLKTIDDKEESKMSNKWGNRLLALRWNHLYNRRLFSNLTLAYTRYRFNMEYSGSFGGKQDKHEYYSRFISGIYDANGKIDFEYYAGRNYKLKFGANGIYHIFRPGITSFRQSGSNMASVDTSYGSFDLHSLEYAAYVDNEITMGPRLRMDLGFRFLLYQVEKKTYFSPEPRILFNYLITDNMALKASYAIMQQNVHLLSGTGAGLPVDLWMPATSIAEPERSCQTALGIARSLFQGSVEFSVEGYYKRMKNLIAYKEGINSLWGTTNWENKIETGGMGESYGIEFLVQKKTGRTTGWIGYTLSRTTRQFDNINFGEAYPYKYDRRHDISVVWMYKLKKNIDLSATWVFGTGNAFTMAEGKFSAINDNPHDPPPFVFNTEAYIYSDRNAYRMRPYHRLDVGVNFHKNKKWGERTWNISIYNVYNRQNPYFYFFDTKYEYDKHGRIIQGSGKNVLKQQSLFPIIPSVSYKFKF